MKNYTDRELSGFETDKQIRQDLDQFKNTFHPVNVVPRTMFNAYCNFAVQMVELVKGKQVQSNLRKCKKQLLTLLNKLPIISLSLNF